MENIDEVRARIANQLREHGLMKTQVSETPFTQATQRAVEVQLTAERDAARREAVALREALERERTRSRERWRIIQETAKHVETNMLSEKLLPVAVKALVDELGAARKNSAGGVWMTASENILRFLNKEVAELSKGGYAATLLTIRDKIDTQLRAVCEELGLAPRDAARFGEDEDIGGNT